MSVQSPNKVYVEVGALFYRDGRMVPRRITWTDGRQFEIDKILDIRRAASLQGGGMGERYTVRINGKERYLFYENSLSFTGTRGGRWFVEKPQ